jgi:imidazolonepropionase-like amidohydrolase
VERSLTILETNPREEAHPPQFPKDARRFAIRAGNVYTAGGPRIAGGVVLVEEGKIRAVGRIEDVQVPDGTPVFKTFAVTPGLIDAHTVVGVSGALNIPADQDQSEKTDPNQADVRILDSFNPNEPLLEFFLTQGVTVIQATPGPADVIAGQAGIFRTHGTTAEGMALRFPSAIVFNLGEVPKSTYAGKAPSTRMGTAAVIRNALTAAVNDRRKRKTAKKGSEPDHSPKNEALALVLDKKLPAIFGAHRADDLATALRLAGEFGLDPVLSLATEGYLMADAIAAAKAPVLVHPTLQRPATPETFNTTLNNAAILAGKGVPVAITSSFEGYVPKTRVPRYEAAMATVHGLGTERGLRAITLDAAKILKIDDRFGSLEPGKVADVVLYDGDPFETTTHVTHVVLGGSLVYDREAQAKLPRRSSGAAGFGEMGCCMGR